MKPRTIVALICVVVLIIIVKVVFLWNVYKPVAPIQTSTSTAQFDQTTSDGTIVFGYSSTTFGLATTEAQLTVRSYIPPCNQGFNYCLYYIGQEYKGTNFESAGVRINKRADLSTEKVCTNTPPDGFDASMKPTSTYSSDVYASSVFANVGDAGAGHYASGALYRLYVKKSSTCYEFETRIGQTQFANYPEGTIKKFTDDDMKKVEASLKEIIDGISLVSRERHLFPF